jgi:predicted TIM-barrel fold metal-dependent hydrolase
MKQLVIDVHTHVYLPRYMTYLRNRSSVPKVYGNPERLVILPGEDTGSTKSGRPIGPEYYDPHTKIQFMKDHKIDISILSLANPWLDFVEPEEAETIAQDLNSDLQAWCQDYPQFYGFGSLPTLSLEGSLREIERIARSHSKLKGVIMGTDGLGKGLDDPQLEPLFSSIAEKGLVIL